MDTDARNEQYIRDEADTIHMEIEMHESPKNTILLGYEIGHGQIDEGREIRIAGSGKTVRFTVYNRETGKRIKEYDLDLTPLAAAVIHR
jgi:hypothetical protein